MLKLMMRNKSFADSKTGEVKTYADIYVSVELIKGEPLDISLKFTDSTQRKMLSACIDQATCKLVAKQGKDKNGNSKIYYSLLVEFKVNGVDMSISSRLTEEQVYILKLASLQK